MQERLTMGQLVLQGERLLLRSLGESDVSEDYISWLNDPDVTRYLEVGKTASTQVTVQAYLERFQEGVTDFIFAIIDIETGLHVGNVTLNHIDPTLGTADTGLMIGRKEFWGRGYAAEGWSLIAEYGFEKHGLRKITAGAAAENKASIGSLLKLGFKIEDTLHNGILVDGEFQDNVRMGLFREEFKHYSRN